jgi:hypothetical protein
MPDMAASQPSLRDFGHAEFHPALKCRASVMASLCDEGPQKLQGKQVRLVENLRGQTRRGCTDGIESGFN